MRGKPAQNLEFLVAEVFSQRFFVAAARAG